MLCLYIVSDFYNYVQEITIIFILDSTSFVNNRKYVFLTNQLCNIDCCVYYDVNHVSRSTNVCSLLAHTTPQPIQELEEGATDASKYITTRAKQRKQVSL